MIDVHAHLLPQALAEVLRVRPEAPRIVDGGALVDCGAGLAYPLLPGLADLEVHRSRIRRDAIALTLLSAPPPGVEGLAPLEAVAVARACNDELAALGEPFGALAVLPLAAPEAAAAELERAASLGLAGAQLFSNAGGNPLDGLELRPLFDAAARLRLPLVLHPTVPVDRRAVADHGLVTALGFVFDTTAAAARLVLSGVYERHPDLVLVLPHAGAAITPFLGRLDYELELMGGAGHLSAPVSEQLVRLYVDTVCESPGALRLAVDEFGPDHVLYGSDEPFWAGGRAAATLDALGLGHDVRERIADGNARRLFRLAS